MSCWIMKRRTLIACLYQLVLLIKANEVSFIFYFGEIQVEFFFSCEFNYKFFENSY